MMEHKIMMADNGTGSDVNPVFDQTSAKSALLAKIADGKGKGSEEELTNATDGYGTTRQRRLLVRGRSPEFPALHPQNTLAS